MIKALSCILFFTSLLAHAQNEIRPGVFYLKLGTGSGQRTGVAGNPFQFARLKGLKSYEPLRKPTSDQHRKPSVLDGLYKVRVDENVNIRDLCKELSTYTNVLYAEPVYQEQLLYMPSDPDASNGSQAYLDVIQAFEAWDVTRGDPGIIIGIIDTGIDRNHPDITPKIYLNQSDPPNGIDDDGNGYTDDYWGYDFADGDSIPQADYSAHGNRVAGIAGAATDNATGIAGVGFHAKISPLKVFTSSENLSAGGYEAILYAADNGYEIINLSWGSADSYSQAAEDIINYAVLEKNVVVIAAAGNTPSRLDFYPASYENVLSVAATNNNDTKASFSTYSYEVDLCAPGNAIYSTSSDASYSTDNGTSYSAPMVAGTAALVKSLFPTLSAEQIRERIRVTTDNIYSHNTGYQDLLGSGRLNVLRAVTETGLKSARLLNVSYHNGMYEKAFYGDTVRLVFDVKNYLNPMKNLTLTFTSESEYVTFLTESLQLGTFSGNETREVAFPAFVLSRHTPANTEISIRIGFADDSYTDFQYFRLTTEPDQVLLDNDNLTLTVAGRGVLGASSGEPTGYLTRQNQVAASGMGLALALSEDQVSDNLPDIASFNDFAPLLPARYEAHPEADYLITSSFNDDSAALPLKVAIDQKIITEESADFIIQEYRIGNTGTTAISQLKAGCFINWDLNPSAENLAFYQDSVHSLIARNASGTLFAGIRTYQDRSPIAQALDLGQAGGNEADVTSLTNDSLVYRLMSERMFDSAGLYGSGNDIGALLVQDSISIDPGKSHKATFFIAVSASYETLTAALDSAEKVYERFLTLPPLLEQVSSCRGGELDIDPKAGTTYRFFSDPYGENLLMEGTTLFAGVLDSDTTFYAVNLDEAYEGEMERIEVRMVERISYFSMNPDTLLLSAGIQTVTFTDESFLPRSWSWDFDNGLKATVQNPEVHFTESGTYDIALTVVNELGCSDTYIRQLLVANRPPAPQLDDQRICPNESVAFSTANSDSLALYLSPEATTPYTTGRRILLNGMDQDTLFYLSQIQGGYESFRVAVAVQVHRSQAGFSFRPDTAADMSQAVFFNTSNEITLSRWYVDGLFTSEQEEFTLRPEKDAYTIGLTVTNQTGCRDSVSTPVQFRKSPAPEVSVGIPCAGDSLLIAPDNGRYFGFYEDETLTRLIRKDTALWLTSVDSGQAFYVVGLDSIYPSEPIPVSVHPEELPVVITASPDTLYLSEQKTVAFGTVTDELVSWKWFRNGVFIESTANPVLYFTEPDTYEMTLTGRSARGCTYSDTLTFPVYETRPIVLSGKQEALNPYPNPSGGRVFVPCDHPSEINVYNLEGHLIRQLQAEDSTWVDLDYLPSGTYLIRLSNAHQVVIWKIILE